MYAQQRHFYRYVATGIALTTYAYFSKCPWESRMHDSRLEGSAQQPWLYVREKARESTSDANNMGRVGEGVMID